MIKKILSILWTLIAFCGLTILTQIGGLVYLFSILLNQKWNKEKSSGLRFAGIFICLYLATTFILTPPLASILGRKSLPKSNSGLVIPNHWLTCLLNRHYVKPEMYKLIFESAEKLNENRKIKLKIRYLDANFPFINGFPLLPHRSHDNGEKLDIAFLYMDKENHLFWNKRISVLGYGNCEVPQKGEINTPQECKRKGYWQYSLLQKIASEESLSEVYFDGYANGALIKTLSDHPSTSKIFIEPHLKHRLGFSNDAKIRFHGCAAVRHDDHIHIEL